MSSSLSSRHRHRPHHHHRRNFPPQGYADLTVRDVRDLAPILTPFPTPGTSAAAAYEHDIRHRISGLPSHLKSKLPWLSTFCKVHRGVNGLVVMDLLGMVRHEVSRRALGVYDSANDDDDDDDNDDELVNRQDIQRLEDVNALWMDSDTFHQTFRRIPPSEEETGLSHQQQSNCGACKLTMISRSVPRLITIGACLIANIDPKNWRKSTRIFWMEEWLKACASLTSGDVLVKAMWDQGVKMREYRQTHRASRGRAYVDVYAAMTMQVSTRVARQTTYESVREMSPTRTVRQTTYEGRRETYGEFAHTPFEDDAEVTDEELDFMTPLPLRFDETSRVRASSVYSRAVDDPALPRQAVPQSQRREQRGSARVRASSVYSRAVDENQPTRVFSNRSGLESEILQLYLDREQEARLTQYH